MAIVQAKSRHRVTMTAWSEDGEGGIRTRGRIKTLHRFSKPAHSATLPPLRSACGRAELYTGPKRESNFGEMLGYISRCVKCRLNLAATMGLYARDAAARIPCTGGRASV